jgi:hypothetical protein
MPQTGEDVMQVTVTGAHIVTPLVHTPAAERNGIVSPDGRWLAYEANDSGSFDIYVRPYPDVASGRWLVSTGGGTRPLWSRDGRELFYVSLANGVMRVGVERATSWAATIPTMLLKDGLVVSAAQNVGRNYDVSPDGKRFLVGQADGRRQLQAAATRRGPALRRDVEASRADEAMTLASGSRLGPYEIVSAIGAGGMGEVYRARDPRLGRDVAIKVLPASLTSDPERLARFQREAQVLASLNHPNIAGIYHVEDTANQPAIVMELVEGETLADRIARGPLPLDEALPIAKQIAEALEAAH